MFRELAVLSAGLLIVGHATYASADYGAYGVRADIVGQRCTADDSIDVTINWQPAREGPQFLLLTRQGGSFRYVEGSGGGGSVIRNVTFDGQQFGPLGSDVSRAPLPPLRPGTKQQVMIRTNSSAHPLPQFNYPLAFTTDLCTRVAGGALRTHSIVNRDGVFFVTPQGPGARFNPRDQIRVAFARPGAGHFRILESIDDGPSRVIGEGEYKGTLNGGGVRVFTMTAGTRPGKRTLWINAGDGEISTSFFVQGTKLPPPPKGK
jgi:hypothetical protein